MNSKIHNMAIFIEFIAGSGLAIFFHLVLHYAEAAYIIFGVGILLSLVTYLIREDIEKTQRKLLDQYDHAHELTFAVAQMSDPECQDKAREVIAGVKRTLALLQQGYIPLDETEFYMKSTKYMDECQRRVKAVDPVTAGWSSRGVLVNFYQANQRAIERGVQITRIFVVSREDLADAEVQKVLTAQLRDGIDVRVAFRDDLLTISDSSGRDTMSSFDFAVYDEQVGTEVYSQPGKYFGRKTREPAAVANYLNLLGLIEHSSHAITIEDDQVVIAAELLQLAS